MELNGLTHIQKSIPFPPALTKRRNNSKKDGITTNHQKHHSKPEHNGVMPRFLNSQIVLTRRQRKLKTIMMLVKNADTCIVTEEI